MIDDGESGAVEQEQYCMPSWQKRNVDEMSKASGYHEMADLSNTPKPPTSMEGAKKNDQKGPEMADNNYNYDKNRS